MSSELSTLFPQLDEKDELIEFWIFGWDNSKIYVTMQHICIYWAVALNHTKLIPFSTVKNITLVKKTLQIQLENEVVILSKFPQDIEIGLCLFLNEVWKPQLGKNEILLKANSNLYLKRKISIPSRTAFCIHRMDDSIEKCFPLKHLIGFEYTSKPWHVKLYDKNYEIEFFIRDVSEWIPLFQSKCGGPAFFIEYESEKYRNWFVKEEINDSSPLVKSKQNRQSTKYVTVRNKLDHPNLDRPKRKKNHSKKKLGISNNTKQELTSWIQIEIQDTVESYFDLETLFDCNFSRVLVFKPWTWYVSLRDSKAKQALDLLQGYYYDQYPLKITKYTGETKTLWEKYLKQYGISLKVPVEFKEESLTIEWIGEVECRTWIGLDFKDGDGNGMFQDKQCFVPKTKSLFVPIENFMILPKKEPVPTKWKLFGKKEKKVIKPVLLKIKSTRPETTGDNTITSTTTSRRTSTREEVVDVVVDVSTLVKESNIDVTQNLSKPRRKKNVKANIHKIHSDVVIQEEEILPDPIPTD
jgi:hypothetical protein